MYKENWPHTRNEGSLKELTGKEFQMLSQYVNSRFGIKLPESKKIMVQSRIMKRLRVLQMNSYSSYLKYVFSEEGKRVEMVNMIDAITTNKTEFFREMVHFDFLKNRVFKEFAADSRTKKMKFWSAGSSSGEEAYSIAISLEEFAARNGRFDYHIVGTDLSTDILKKAKNAIYTDQRVADIPPALKKKYFLKSRDPLHQTVMVVPELREKVQFRYLNFIDSDYRMPEIFDVIFCRNTLIYFERDVQEAVINKLCRNLRTGGYFFLGHSESIMQMDVPLRQIQPTIFKKV
jgi:chemotaxis protein methyltransferase CheR